ncbi:IS21 family transposase [Micromonospora globbae]|uniref:IS21 family transposase n=1 Tax=Micromonospora globbae TaxID=1894969 RepID=UPI0037BB9BE4
MRPKVELFEAIRRDARREDLSIRALAERHGVHRRTVRQALACAVPAPRKPRVAQAPKLDPVKSVIDEMLVADLTAPRKQRHTARRIHARLVDEHDASGLSYSTVRDYVRRRRPEIAVDAGRCMQTAFVVQSHAPGAEAEVDFGDVWVEVAGEKLKCFMFAFRLSYSGKAVHKVFASQGQEAFIEGHVHAFMVIGGVPTDKIRYDNLRSAVSRVLLGRNRTESEHWVAFRSHYGFDPFYCMPGIDGAHEKGGVEGEVGRFRRTHLSPMPVVDSLAELNERIEAADRADDNRRIAARVRTVGQDFAVEAPLLASLPSDGFEPGLWLTPRVDRFARVTVRCCHYSVPAGLIGRQVRVCLRACELIVFDGRREVARHARSVSKGSQTLVLDHYLEVFVRKPGALPGATALAQAREVGMFTPAHDAFWAQARRALGDAGGTRALVEVLLLHRYLPHVDVVAGIEAALRVGATTADVVAVEARKTAQHPPDPRPHLPAEVPPVVQVARVVSLTERRLADPAAVIGGLPPDPRPLPSVAHYDELLKLRRPSSPPVSGPPANPGRVS